MTNNEFDDYWAATKEYILIDFEGIRKDIISMLGGNAVEVNVHKFLNTMTDFHSKDDIFT